jgi:DNA polymerase III epsilon subunit-like protein
MTEREFIVIDTEGKSALSEIAVIDSQGKLIYEAFTEDHQNNTAIRLKCKSLRDIVSEFAALAQGKTLVCHYAAHDSQVLHNSFVQARVRLPSFSFECSCQLARRCFPNLPGYSLGYLSKHFRLRVENRLFDANCAHTARYDAEFTYHLYRKLKEHLAMYERLRNTYNPFSSSRVDTPFQDHIDLQAVYHSEYEILKSIINDIKCDPNQQSKGAVVIGEAGAGKTHLMMRLAKERLKTNRLLFIRQPNNANVDLDLNQLFERSELDDILSQNSIRAVLNRAAAYYRYKAQNIPLPSAPLACSKPTSSTSLETRLHRLENEVNQLKQAIAGITTPLQPLSAFPQEAIATSDVSTEHPTVAQVERETDEIVADYLLQKQRELEQDYDARPQIISDSDDWGKLNEIVAAFGLLQSIDIDQLRLGKKVLPEHLQLKIGDRTFVIGFLNLSSSSFFHRIANFNQLVLSHPQTQFRLIRDAREPQITGKKSKEEIGKLSHSPNGLFAIMDKTDRINFELAYNLIVDIHNRDVDADMVTALHVLSEQLNTYWLSHIMSG